MMENLLVRRLQKRRENFKTGIYSVCSINSYVLQAAMKQAKADHSVLLIESTSNQVDQFGGYSGLTPDRFMAEMQILAKEMNFPPERLIFGGDHLGPNVWQNRPAEEALKNAADQIHAYVKAGYTKIHLDTSMRCLNDPSNEKGGLPAEIVAERAAELCLISEQAFQENKSIKIPPVYIIGSDVPIPGGAHEDLDDIEITSVLEVDQTIQLTREAFLKKGLDSAWDRVIAVVVQPGIEFSDTKIFDYDRQKARDLTDYIKNDNMIIYEAHSTDYQHPDRLQQLVEDHFAILKVGPWLTFALREAIFALANIEEELFSKKRHIPMSKIRNTIEQIMLKKPQYWQKHYHGSDLEKALARSFSLSDRIRYYWSDKTITDSLNVLIRNLSENKIPLSLISQYLPNQYRGVREAVIENAPAALIHDKIREILKYYARATDMLAR